MHKFIYDESQVEKFFNILTPLGEHESYFLTTAVRMKYLSQEEKDRIQGGDRMIGRKLAKEGTFANYLRVLKTMEISDGGYTSIADVKYPSDCLAIYGRLNTTCGRKALQLLKKETDKIVDKLIDGIEDKHTKKMKSLDSLLMSCFQIATGTKTYIDIDFDTNINTVKIAHDTIKDFVDNGITCYVVETKGGIHCILDRSTIKYNYTRVVSDANKAIKKIFPKGEASMNKKELLPIPGTLQCGYKVRMYTAKEWLDSIK